MRCPTWVTAREIDHWAETTTAKDVLAELIHRLVLATVDRENLKDISFPAHEEAHRHGYDGRTLTDINTPHVPQGLCAWELSCDGNPERKAERDYRKRLKDAQNWDISQLTYIAVTARDWTGAATWAGEKTAEGKFKQVRAYDSNDLEHWLLRAPAVGLWLAEQIGNRTQGVSGVGDHWTNVLGALKKGLPPELLLTNRQGTAKALAKWLAGNPGLLAVRAPSPQEMVDVFAAWVHTLTPEQADAVASRTIIVDDALTLQALATSKERLILVAGPRLEATQELFAEVRRQGHHLLRFAAFTEPKGSDIVEMERMRLHDLKEALHKAGMEEREAAQLAESAGGSFTVLRRRFTGSVGIARPEWANGVEVQDLASLLLAAAWNQANADDCKAVEKLTGKPYSEVEKLAVRLLLVADSPLRRILMTWEFVSPQDAWTLLHSTLTSSLVNAFELVIVDVLGENDPALDLPPEKRFLAPMQGKRLKFSEALRRGLAEILALSAGLASEGLVADDHNFIGRARSIVCRLLPAGSDWKRWASIGDLLPLLAEAAPEEFLNAVTQDLKSPDPALVELMRQEYGDVITGAIYHTGLLWALEALAWSTKYTAVVADLLAKLATLDPGGRWGNRPSASLKNLFFSWRPQTVATFDELLAILGWLNTKQPDAAWKLLRDILPKLHSSIIDSYKPSPWRSWTAGWTGDVIAADYLRYISGVVDLVLNLAVADGSHWPELLDRCTALFPADRSRIFAALEKISPGTLSDKERVSLWETLREMVQKHTAFGGADWALPADEVGRLAQVRDRFAPQDEVQIAVPLFAQGQLMYENGELSGKDPEASLRQRRMVAVERIWNKEGFSGVRELATKVKESWRVGVALAEAKGAEPESQIIPDLLCSSDKQIEGFAVGYAARRIDAEGQDWAERIPTAEWTPEQIAAFACRMPFNSRTWAWVENVGRDVKHHYWTKAGTWSIPQEQAHLEKAARELLQAKRSATAVELLAMGMYNKVPVPSALLFEALEAMLSADKEDWRALETYYVQQMIKRLQADEQADESRLARLEFEFLFILGPQTVRAETLERMLARDPKLFVDCLKVLYGPRHGAEEEEPKQLDPHDAQRANLIWGLLRDWQWIPGTQPDGSISVSELHEWVTTARSAAREADRLEVCDIKIGEVFARAPSDDEGVKPCVPVREVIEALESKEIDRGFANGLYNLRGAFWRGLHDGGQQERELAASYERYAKACETVWPRTATILRSVADTYLRDAERADAEALMRK